MSPEACSLSDIWTKISVNEKNKYRISNNLFNLINLNINVLAFADDYIIITNF